MLMSLQKKDYEIGIIPGSQRSCILVEQKQKRQWRTWQQTQPHLPHTWGVMMMQTFITRQWDWPAQGTGQLGHCLVEGNVLEELHPWEEHADGHGWLEHCAKVAQGGEVCIVIRILNTHILKYIFVCPRCLVHLKQCLEILGDHEGGVDIEGDVHHAENQHQDIQIVPDTGEVAPTLKMHVHRLQDFEYLYIYLF